MLHEILKGFSPGASLRQQQGKYKKYQAKYPHNSTHDVNTYACNDTNFIVNQKHILFQTSYAMLLPLSLYVSKVIYTSLEAWMFFRDADLRFKLCF